MKPKRSRQLLFFSTTLVLAFFVLQQDLSGFALAAWLLFTPVAVKLTIVDLAEQRLPNALTLPAFVMVSVLIAMDAFALENWREFWRAMLWAILLAGFYLLLNLVSRGGMGLGDVKLALALGVLLGSQGSMHVMAATVLAFVSSAAVGLSLLAARRANLKTQVPFGPFMLAGAYATLAMDLHIAAVLVAT